jgi:hypothetical protein
MEGIIVIVLISGTFRMRAMVILQGNQFCISIGKCFCGWKNMSGTGKNNSVDIPSSFYCWKKKIKFDIDLLS